MNVQLSIYLILIANLLHAQYATKITVDVQGGGDYTSIQDAIDGAKAFPDQDITINIKNGVYQEKVIVYSWNNRLTIIGESRDGTIIRWDDHFGKISKGRNSTFHTYTLKVAANDVTLTNLTIENTAGPVGQAVALHLEGDRISIIDCRINGHQDTYYGAGEGARQFFHNCTISGTTDFIFGASTAIFDQCTILSKANAYITAASTPASSPYGFVFIDCKLNAIEGVDEVYLGRPWRPFAKTAFINCEMNQHIQAAGWHNWSAEEKEKTVTYLEFGTSGADTSKRVPWAKTLTEKEASHYTIEQIFGDWSPLSTSQE